MSNVYGIAWGTVAVGPPVLQGAGVPSANLKGALGQSFFDTLTAPWSQYIWNGTSWSLGGSGSLVSVIGDAGTAAPSAGAITLSGGTTGLTTSASGSTVNLTGTLNVGHGGTGVATQAAYSLVAGGTTTTGAFQAVGPVASGQLLQSAGTSTLPAFTGSPSVSGSLTAGTTLTATLGNITATNGNLSLGTAGNKLLIAATSSATCSAGTFTLGGGATTTVNNTAITASSLVFLSTMALGTVSVASTLAVTSVSAGVHFVVTPSQSTDTSVVAYLIIN